ncbi:hypothetical protein GOV12_01320 [Candidatus Pacearchaeota archaeon]|nr:hypothetical protein [Candidatus Pacearchaeota archaeon]
MSINSINKEKVKKEAKSILNKFSKALASVEKEKDVDSYVDRDEFMRVEGKGVDCEPGFKKRFLENSKKHDDDFILAEKGEWKK